MRSLSKNVAHPELRCFENRTLINRAITFDNTPVIGEIGIFKGDYAKFLIETYRPKEMHLFDLFREAGQMGSGDVDGNHMVVTTGAELYQVVTEMFSANQAVTFHEGDSKKTVPKMPDDYFDLMYIDGDHSYEGCLADLRNSYLKVKDGGWIAGHDFAVNLKKCETWWEFGVRKAVSEFCKEKNLKVNALFLDGCVSYAIQVHK